MNVLFVLFYNWSKPKHFATNITIMIFQSGVFGVWFCNDFFELYFLSQSGHLNCSGAIIFNFEIQYFEQLGNEWTRIYFDKSKSGLAFEFLSLRWNKLANEIQILEYAYLDIFRSCLFAMHHFNVVSHTTSSSKGWTTNFTLMFLCSRVNWFMRP